MIEDKIYSYALHLMMYPEYQETAIRLRKESVQLREKLLLNKDLDKLFKQLANEEMSRYRALDWCIKWAFGTHNKPSKDQISLINRTLSEIDYYTNNHSQITQ